MVKTLFGNRCIRNIIGVLICLSICLSVFNPGQAQSGSIRNIPHTKTVEKHADPKGKWDGTYDLTIGVNSPYSEENGARNLNILFICDVSPSMDLYRSQYAEAVRKLITELEKNSQLDSEYSMVVFSGKVIDSNGYDVNPVGNVDRGFFDDALVTTDWKHLETAQDISEFAGAIENNNNTGGFTNYEAGLLSGFKQLEKLSNDRKEKAETVVIFVTDGIPNLYYDDDGRTQLGTLIGFSEAVSLAADFQVDYFYGVFFGENQNVIPNPPKMSLEIVEDVVNAAVVSVESKTYHATNADELIEHLTNIAYRIEGTDIFNVMILDRLHKFTQFVECDARLTLRILDADGNIVAESKPGEYDASLTFTDENETVTMYAARWNDRVRVAFDPADYVLNHNYTYELTMHVEPSASAQTYYNEKHGYPHIGDENTGVHSLEEGFYANEEALLRCSYKDPQTGSEVELALPYAKPVLRLKQSECGLIPCCDCLLPATGFPTRPGTLLREQPAAVKYDSVNMRLQLPTLNVETELVRVPLTDKTWQVEWLGNKAGVLEGSSLPGAGFSIIAAHNSLNDFEIGPFALLSKMDINDMIIVQNSRNKSQFFHVYENKLMRPSDFAAIASIAEQVPNSLILITCENESADGGYLNRRVIFAKPD